MSKDFLLFSPNRSALLPQEFQALITDTLESPGTFILIHYLSKSLKGGLKCDLISNDVENYEKILRKTGIQLNTEIAKGTFNHFSTQQAINNVNSTPLAAIIEKVSTSNSTLLILDDISDLLWSGHSPKSLVKFIATLRQILFSRGGSIIVLLHGDDLTGTNNQGSPLDEFLFRSLLQTSDLWLQTTSISSQSRGELSIHRGPALLKSYGIITKSGSKALSYKLEESGATYSEKGLGRGFI